MNSTPAPLAPPAPPARKIGPANAEYDRRVVHYARTLTMDTRGKMVERVTASLGPRRVGPPSPAYAEHVVLAARSTAPFASSSSIARRGEYERLVNEADKAHAFAHGEVLAIQ